MNQVLWYPPPQKHLREPLLAKLIDAMNDDKLTIWGDEDDNGRLHYVIRPVEQDEDAQTNRQ